MNSHRVLVIGVGSIGERHLRCFGRTDRCDVSICEINEPLRQTIAERYGIGSAFGNLDDALNDPPDAAVICAPAHLHIPMATQLAEAGVHLLIEKPLSTGFEGIDRLFSLVQEQNLSAAVAYVARMNPALAAMREAIQSGRFDEPLQIVGLSGQNFPFYRPAYREIYYNNRATGGGAIQDALTHMMNSGQWLVGPTTELAADAAHLALEGVDVEDTVHVIARHGAVMGSYALNQHQAPNETSITVVCSKGTARCEFHRNRWLSATTTGDDWKVEQEFTIERDDGFVAQANRFLDAIEGKSEPACSLAEGLHTLQTNLAVLQAADTQTWQTITPGGDQ
ncbi:MAG: Gfo/Idh/MocA family oxidoreductase [Planctomycetaceae bacterium]|jgi:predicted dehydrogenase|nr:Gfo/Idh/MocA family oxidoreductase [Planctomycetaceae bacterium]MBT6153136.1 Gfo/Idh/MocA family oxidoreductase [Planctomycetaceae bacterium]MBT6483559.1 Gfo/Idh/MocA family oxidoreductase [Planctomycetaceae bacterium]MBT6497791.1 Gfo/Idh/MocA family oxidoreductase [Planctomycetaceae bacterium]